jgi:hypothetical protein
VTTNPTPNKETAMPTSHTVELTRLPSWATSSFIEDGMAFSKRESELCPEAELVQASELVIDVEAGTVSCRVAEEPTIWLPGSNQGITLAQARNALAGLQELLGVLEAASATVDAARHQDEPEVE